MPVYEFHPTIASDLCEKPNLLGPIQAQIPLYGDGLLREISNTMHKKCIEFHQYDEIFKSLLNKELTGEPI